MNPLQIAAYAFGVFNALACIAMIYNVAQKSGVGLLERSTLCAVGISVVAYLSLRVCLLYVGIH